MINYQDDISKSGLSIYDLLNDDANNLYIPTDDLEEILSEKLIGLSLANLPLRTRSRVVKENICYALGYPVPKSFKKTQPRFVGQNFDVYTQKSLNVQIWNEDVDLSRRYIFIKVDDQDVITRVRVITGDILVQYDRTGTLTQKFQATMKAYPKNICSANDTDTIASLIAEGVPDLSAINPSSFPEGSQLLCIRDVFERLLPIVGKKIKYLDALQERNRGAELHALICNHLGYSDFNDDGTYPDIANQLLEVKLQTSPTIDLGMHSPEDGAEIAVVENTPIHSKDIRYAILNGVVDGEMIELRNLYLVTGEDFSSYFPLFKGKQTNTKIQLPLPSNFFD